MTCSPCLDARHIRCTAVDCSCTVCTRVHGEAPRIVSKPRNRVRTVTGGRHSRWWTPNPAGRRPQPTPAPMAEAVRAALAEGQSVSSVSRHSGLDRRRIMAVRDGAERCRTVAA